MFFGENNKAALRHVREHHCHGPQPVDTSVYGESDSSTDAVSFADVSCAAGEQQYHSDAADTAGESSDGGGSMASSEMDEEHCTACSISATDVENALEHATELIADTVYLSEDEAEQHHGEVDHGLLPRRYMEYPRSDHPDLACSGSDADSHRAPIHIPDAVREWVNLGDTHEHRLNALFARASGKKSQVLCDEVMEMHKAYLEATTNQTHNQMDKIAKLVSTVIIVLQKDPGFADDIPVTGHKVRSVYHTKSRKNSVASALPMPKIYSFRNAAVLDIRDMVSILAAAPVRQDHQPPWPKPTYKCDPADVDGRSPSTSRAGQRIANLRPGVSTEPAKLTQSEILWLMGVYHLLSLAVCAHGMFTSAHSTGYWFDDMALSRLRQTNASLHVELLRIGTEYFPAMLGEKGAIPPEATRFLLNQLDELTDTHRFYFTETNSLIPLTIHTHCVIADSPARLECLDEASWNSSFGARGGYVMHNAAAASMLPNCTVCAERIRSGELDFECSQTPRCGRWMSSRVQIEGSALAGDKAELQV